jgi:cytochrome c551
MRLINNGQLTMNNWHHFILLLLLSIACSPKNETKKYTSTKYQQYYIQGERLYIQHCSNCHQKNGRGLGLVYPPLDTSDYLTNNFEKVLCLIRNGKEGAIVVNGKSYNQKMTGIPSLTDLEIAEIVTYVYNTWSHQRGIVEVKEVSAALSTCTKE